MKPMMIVAPNILHSDAIKALRDNGICVVTAKDPDKVRFLDTIPATSSRSQMEQAAIKLSRKLLHGYFDTASTANIAKLYVDLLVQGTELSGQPTQAEMEKQVYNQERLDEMRRLAREDAKAERLKLKQQDKT